MSFTVPYNPFTNRATIIKEEEFIGREEEIGVILSRVRDGNSNVIVGNRKVGKSSLLYHLFLTGNKRFGDANKNCFHFIHLHMQDPRYSTTIRFCKNLFQGLGLQQIAINSNTDDLEYLSYLSQILDDFYSRGKLPVLLIDEFETLIAKPDRFNYDFFDSFRGFVANHKLVMIATSGYSLTELKEKSLTSSVKSPFWDVFAIQYLGDFVVSDIANEVALFLSHYWTSLEPTIEEQKYLASYWSQNPLVMQIVSYWVFRNRELKLNEISLKEQINREILYYFGDKKEIISKWLKIEVPKKFQKFVWTSEQIGRIIKAFSPLSITIGN